MTGDKNSVAKETLVYKVDPQTLLGICQDILKRVGRVTKVSQETGVIFGTVKATFVRAEIIVRVSRQEDATELSIQTSHVGVLAGNGAQRGIMNFIEALGRDERLKGKSGAV